jgi:hypothetical protein
MATLLAVLIFATLIAAVAALLLVAERRQARRQHEVSRQIALTDALHARLGAVVAPVVRRRQRAWQVVVAVPFERPEVVTAVLATTDEVLGRVRYEVVLSRQAPAVSNARVPRRAALGRESLSWT